MSTLFTSVSTWIKFLVSLRNSSLVSTNAPHFRPQIVLDLWQGGLLDAFDQLKEGEISIEGFIASLPDWVKKLFQEYVEKQVSTQVANQVAAHVAAAVSNVVTDAVTSAVSATPSASDIAKAVVAEVAQSGTSLASIAPVAASGNAGGIDSTGYASPTVTTIASPVISVLSANGDVAAIADAVKNFGTSLPDEARRL